MPQNGLGILLSDSWLNLRVLKSIPFLNWKNVPFYMPSYFSVMQDKKNVLFAFFEDGCIIILVFMFITGTFVDRI